MHNSATQLATMLLSVAARHRSQQSRQLLGQLGAALRYYATGDQLVGIPAR